MYTHTYVYILYIHACLILMAVVVNAINTCMYVPVYTYVYISIYMYIYIYMYFYDDIYIYI